MWGRLHSAEVPRPMALLRVHPLSSRVEAAKGGTVSANIPDGAARFRVLDVLMEFTDWVEDGKDEMRLDITLPGVTKEMHAAWVKGGVGLHVTADLVLPPKNGE